MKLNIIFFIIYIIQELTNTMSKSILCIHHFVLFHQFTITFGISFLVLDIFRPLMLTYINRTLRFVIEITNMKQININRKIKKKKTKICIKKRKLNEI